MSEIQSEPTSKTNVMAIVALVTGVLGIPTLGIIFGHIALSQIKSSQESGRGLAIAGLVLGYLVVGFCALLVVFIALASVSTLNANSN